MSFAAERHLNDLRDTADQDYVLARAAIRDQLDTQFLWLAQQAIEKYLKLLLVFNCQSAKKYDHDIIALYQQVVTIDELPLGFPATVPNFVSYLAARANRYAERSYAVSLRRLIDFDQAVWYARRFCENLRGNSNPRLQLTEEQIRAGIVSRADPHFTRHPEHFTLRGSWLEKLRSERASRLRRALTWNNLYFTRRRRTKASESFSRAVNTYLVLEPEILVELSSRLKFSGKRRPKGGAG